MATPLTWRNVELQNFGSTLGAMSDANAGIGRSFDALGKVLAGNELRAREQATQQAVAGALLANDLAALDAVRGQVVGPGANPLVDAAKVAQAVNQQGTQIRTNRVADDDFGYQQWLQSETGQKAIGSLVDAQKTGDVDMASFGGYGARLKDDILTAQSRGQTYVAGREDEMHDRDMDQADLALRRAADARAAQTHKRVENEAADGNRAAQLAREITAGVLAKNPAAPPETVAAAVQASLRGMGVTPKLEGQVMQHVPGEYAFNTNAAFDQLVDVNERGKYADAPALAPGQRLSTEQAKQQPVSALIANMREIDNQYDIRQADAERENWQAVISKQAKDPANRDMTLDQAWKAAGLPGEVPDELTRYQNKATPFEIVQIAARTGAINRDSGFIGNDSLGFDRIQNNNLSRALDAYLPKRNELEKESDRILAKIEREREQDKKAAQAEILRRRYGTANAGR